MSVTHTGFHAHTGWYFERQKDGSVKISAAVDRCTETIILTAAEWPSVVAAVCADGKTSEAYQTAVRLHDQPATPYTEQETTK
jgi:hypothetical protein